jgi:hypothetical protein
MSQLPYATYNPTATPVQSSVVPFVPAPVPQEVQIGTGIENLGPAFSAFSQTLASFVANQVTTNREQALKAGEDKLLKSRKRFKDLVASGEISPQENPWEALGAAAADGTLAAQQFRVRAQAAYNDKIMKDPSFAMSVTGGEEFINEMLANELSNGMQNPVWQRSFMKESASFAAHVGAVHGDNVAKFRRQKINDAMTSGITADIEAFKRETKNLDPANRAGDAAVLKSISDRTLGTIQSRFDEAFQTIGPDALRSAYQTLVDIEAATGSDPAVMEMVGKIKAGTGRAVETEQYRAAKMEKQEIIDSAKLKRDTSLAADLYLDSLSKFEPMDYDEFAQAVRDKVRPDISEDDLSQIYAAVSKQVGPVKDAMLKQFEGALMTDIQDSLLKAYTPGPAGLPPMDADMQLVRDPQTLKQAVRRRYLSAAQSAGVTVEADDLDKKVDAMISTVQYEASQRLVESTMNLPPATRMQVLANYATSTGTSVAGIGRLNEAAAQVTSFKTAEVYAANAAPLESGLALFREALNAGVEPERFGFTEGAKEFYSLMNDASVGGVDAQTAAITAANQRAVRDPGTTTKMNSAIYEAASEMDPTNGPMVAAASFGPFWSEFMANSGARYAPPDSIKAAFKSWTQNNVAMIGGEPVVYSRSLPIEARSPQAWENLNDIVKAKFKSIGGTSAGITSVHWVLNTDGSNYTMYVKRGTRSRAELPTEEEAEKLMGEGGVRAGGIPVNIGAQEMAGLMRMITVKNQTEENVERAIRERNRLRGFGGGRIR